MTTTTDVDAVGIIEATDKLARRAVMAENRVAFEQSPLRYVPQYGGFCSSGAAFGLKLGSDPTEFVIRDGRLFIFGDIAGKTAWLIDPAWNIEHADTMWPEAGESGWRWQSL